MNVVYADMHAVERVGPEDATITKPEESEKTVNDGTPLQQLASKLSSIFAKTQYREMYGVELVIPEKK